MSEYCYKYPRPAVTTDILILAYDEENLKVLLIQRKNYPYEGFWALPGGFVDMDETVEHCAYRELFEETNLKNVQLKMLTIMSEPNRDPRGRTITVVFWTLVKNIRNVRAKDDAKNIKWFNINELPQLAFDHSQILQIALKQLKQDLNCCPMHKNYITKELTLKELERLTKLLS